MRSFIVLFLAAMLVSPLVSRADGGEPSGRTLRIIEPAVGPNRLNPAFELIMEKLDNDLHYVASSPFRLTPKGTAALGMTLLTSFFLLDNDGKVLGDISGRGDNFQSDYYDAFNDLGNYIVQITAGAYLVGYLMEDMNIKSGALMSLEAAALTALFGGAAEFVLGRNGPGSADDPQNFKPFSGFGSMPDMDTALTFSTISVLAYGQGTFSSIMYYAVATGVGLAQVYFEDAWPSDVFLGAILGTAIGRTVAYLSSTDDNASVSFAPMFVAGASHAMGIKVVYRF